MKRDDTLRVVHGMRLFMPPEWEDTSIYRFNAPASEADEAGGDLRLQPNVMVSRHEKQAGDTPGRFLELTNQDAKKADATFEVVRSGSVMFLDQECEWQDAKFTDPRTSQVVHQRRVLTVTWPNHFTLLTLTGAPAAIDKMSAEMGLEHLGATRSGVNVDGVGAVLVSAGPAEGKK